MSLFSANNELREADLVCFISIISKVRHVFGDYVLLKVFRIIYVQENFLRRYEYSIFMLSNPKSLNQSDFFDHLNYDQSGRSGALSDKGTCCLRRMACVQLQRHT